MVGEHFSCHDSVLCFVVVVIVFWFLFVFLHGSCSSVFGLPQILATVPCGSQMWRGWKEVTLAQQRPSLPVYGEIWLTDNPQVCAVLQNRNDNTNFLLHFVLMRGWRVFLGLSDDISKISV